MPEKYCWAGCGHESVQNDYWIFPGEDETPKAASAVEGGCYW